jgi:hypothetical protein
MNANAQNEAKKDKFYSNKQSIEGKETKCETRKKKKRTHIKHRSTVHVDKIIASHALECILELVGGNNGQNSLLELARGIVLLQLSQSATEVWFIEVVRTNVFEPHMIQRLIRVETLQAYYQEQYSHKQFTCFLFFFHVPILYLINSSLYLVRIKFKQMANEVLCLPRHFVPIWTQELVTS